MIYDIDGTPQAGEVTPEEVSTAFREAVAEGDINFGIQIGATLPFNNLSQAWQDNATSAYNSLKAAYKAIANNGIPFFISTDQHGRGLEQHRWANNIDIDGVNFASINLGDNVVDLFNYSGLQGYRHRTEQVKNYISITGNHDAWWGIADNIPTAFDLSHYFHSTFRRTLTTGNNSSYTVNDAEHQVKFLVVDNYTNVGVVFGQQPGSASLSGDLADWLIKEMSKDEADLVYLQHWMLYAEQQVYKFRDGTADTNIIGGSQTLRSLVTARRNKLAGSVTDMDGVSHSYDFTGCSHDLLCALHGHEHDEVYATLDNLLCYVSDWFGNDKTCVFGLIDRGARTLTIWKFDSTAVYDPFVMNL